MFSKKESVHMDSRDSTTEHYKKIKTDHYKKINRQLSVYMISANTERTQLKHEPITLVRVTIEKLTNLHPWCDICLTF